MKTKIRKGCIIIVGIVLNVLGRTIAQKLNLPIWFDMIGTFVATYYAGLWGGILVGISNNVLSGIYDPTALVYSLTSVLAAVMMHYLVKKDYMNNPLKVIVASFWMGILCTVVSTPLNLIFYDGYSGNSWGDTLVDMLRWYDVPIALAAIAGEAVVEIVDKQVCVVAAYLLVFVLGHWKKKPEKQVQNLALFMVLCMGLFVAAQSFCVSAEEPEYQDSSFVRTVYDNTNGMVSSEANIICETDDGYIWIGSYAGLTKYDGNQFEFVREGGLVNVVDMMTDSRGRLWIGTNDAGIARYEEGTYTYFTVEDGLTSNSIRCFAEDADGNIYVGTSNKICRFRPDDTIEIFCQDISFAKAMTVYYDWLIVMDNTGCLYVLDGKQAQGNIVGELNDLFYYCLTPTSRGLMVGTESGDLFIIDISDSGELTKKRIEVSANQISAIYEDSKERIWIAKENELGYLLPDGTYVGLNYEGFDSSIVSFHEDYQGNIWAASTHYGAIKLSETAFVNLFDMAGIEKEYINAVICYNGDYYCGIDTGLIILNGNTLERVSNELTQQTDGCRVRSLYTDAKGRLWVCTYNGLFCYSPQNGIERYHSETHEVTSDRFRCITELADGTIVAGTADGINYIKDGSVTGTVTAQNGLGNTQILSIVEGNDGAIWAGSDGSGIYILSGENLIANYTVEDGLSSNVILRIIPHDDGYFVVTSNALCHIDADGHIRKLEAFPYFNNFDVILEQDTAFVTCSAGLYEVPLSQLCADQGEQFRLYGAREGLSAGLTANSWNYVPDQNRLLLCSNNGVIVFNRNRDVEESDIKFGIISVECDGEEISVGEDCQIEFPQSAKNLSIYASVRNYGFQDVKVRFYIKDLESAPKLYSWDEIEPVKLFKPELSQYTICLEIWDNSGQYILESQEYKVFTQAKSWEDPVFKTYLVVVSIEIILFTMISIASMFLFVMRKNELERLQIDLENKVREQTGVLRDQQNTIKKQFLQTVTALSEAVDAKDRYTSGHSKRVAEYARMIAARMGKSKDEQEEIYRAGLLHDIGKLRIPAEIINKPGKLTEEEYNIMKIHPVTGYHILRGISDNNFIAVAAKYHHERYDGKGYPNGLVGEKIPEVARILSVADSYDAMASNRSYRNALPQEIVRSEIENGMGTQFDPSIAKIMLQMIDEDRNYSMKQMISKQRKILTVDDEAMNHKIIAHIMRDEPRYEMYRAYSGREALAMLEQQSFDLILLDVRMPDMDGLETLREIRKKYQTPVVLMTSDKTLDTSMEFEELGCDDYITKPFLPLLIKEVVHYMTERIDMEQ